MVSPTSGPQPLSAGEINNLIELLIGNDTPLRAVDRDGAVFLRGDDAGQQEEVPLSDEDRTRDGAPRLLYEYAVNFGYTNDDFDEWIGS